MNSSSQVDVFSMLLGIDQLPEEEYLLFSTAVAVNVLHLIAWEFLLNTNSQQRTISVFL